MSPWEVELESALPGSQKIQSVIRFLTGGDPKATIRNAVISAITFLSLDVASWSIDQVLDYIKGPDAPAEASAMSEKDKTDLAVEIVQLLKAEPGREKAVEVYDELEKSGVVTGAGVTSVPNKRPSVVIPRVRFPQAPVDRITQDSQKRMTSEKVELTLLRPVLSNDKGRRWGFQSVYGYFGAPIQDQAFLTALEEGRLNVPLIPGIRMLVEMEITEELDGQVWRPIERTVKTVLKVSAPPRQGNLDLQNSEQQ